MDEDTKYALMITAWTVFGFLLIVAGIILLGLAAGGCDAC